MSLVASHTCRAGDDGKARQDAVQTAKHHGLEIISLFTVRFFVGLARSGVVEEPETEDNGGETTDMSSCEVSILYRRR